MTASFAEPSEETQRYMLLVERRIDECGGMVMGGSPREVAEALCFTEGEFKKVYKALWHLVKAKRLCYHRAPLESRNTEDRPLSYRRLHAAY